MEGKSKLDPSRPWTRPSAYRVDACLTLSHESKTTFSCRLLYLERMTEMPRTCELASHEVEWKLIHEDHSFFAKVCWIVICSRGHSTMASLTARREDGVHSMQGTVSSVLTKIETESRARECHQAAMYSNGRDDASAQRASGSRSQALLVCFDIGILFFVTFRQVCRAVVSHPRATRCTSKLEVLGSGARGKEADDAGSHRDETGVCCFGRADT